MERTSRVVVVNGMFGGRAQRYEVARERWYSTRTRRWRTVWVARQVGGFGWHTGRPLRKALRSAACVRDGRPAAWVAQAVRDVEEAIG
jgi:hypothetical protein